MSEAWDDFLGDLKGHFLQGLPLHLDHCIKELKDFDSSFGLRLRSYLKEMKEPQKDAKNCSLNFFSDYLGDYLSQLSAYESEAFDKKQTIAVDMQKELFELIEKVHADIKSYALLLNENQDKFEFWEARNNTFIYIASLFSSLKWTPETIEDQVDRQSLQTLEENENHSVFPMSNVSEKKKIEDSWIDDLYLICARGEHDLALSIDNVVEVIQKRKIIPLPESRSEIKGLFSLRGEVIPVISLDGFDDEENDKLVVICKKEKNKFAFLSSRADQVVKISKKDMQDPVHLSNVPQSEVIESFVLRESKILFICNLKAMVAA